MDKISAILRLTFVMLLVSSLTFAQYETNPDTQQTQGTDQGTQTDQQGQTNQGTQGNQDNQGTDMLGGQDDDQFRQTAMTLAQDLQSRLTLTNDQVEEVTDILVDYKNEISDIKRDKSDEARATGNAGDDATGTTGTGTTGTGTTGTGETGTGTTGTGTTDTETDRTDVAGDTTETGITGEDNEMLGGRTDYAEKFREADVSANEDIEGVLEEEQLARYIQIKRDWWDTVKDRVHSAAASENQMENAEDEGILNNNNNNN